MAKVYDIVSRLKNEKPQIKLSEEHTYPVRNSKNSVILMKGISEDPKIEDDKKIDMIIEAGIGKEALEYIETMDLSFTELMTIVNAIMAAVADEELEEIEKLGKIEAKKNTKK